MKAANNEISLLYFIKKWYTKKKILNQIGSTRIYLKNN